MFRTNLDMRVEEFMSLHSNKQAGATNAQYSNQVSWTHGVNRR